MANSDFDSLFNGTLYSILTWDRLTAFWETLDTGAGWYIYALGEDRPDSPADSTHVSAFVREIDTLLRREHDEDYCGIVYADDLDNPQLIKIFDPNNLGSSCGSSKNPPGPGWVMSRAKPDELLFAYPAPENRKRWWRSLLGDS